MYKKFKTKIHKDLTGCPCGCWNFWMTIKKIPEWIILKNKVK